MYRTAIAATLLITLLAACGQAQRFTASGGQELAGLPPLPEDREASEELVLSPSPLKTHSRSPQATDDNGSLLLDASGSPQWAVYALDFATGNDQHVDVLLSNQQGGGLWLAMADYAAGRWSMRGRHLDDALQLPVEASLLSGSNRLYLAVIAPQGCVASIDAIVNSFESGWQFTNTGIFLGNNSIQEMSALSVGGHPALVLHDATDAVLYLRSSSADGALAADWQNPVVLEATANGIYADMLLVDGNPAICYESYNDEKLRYVRSNTALGLTADDWAKPVELAVVQQGASMPSLAIINGTPAVCFVEYGDLFYTRSTSVHGDQTGDWTVPLLIDEHSPEDDLVWPALVEVDGNPAVGYMKSSPSSIGGNGRLFYVRSSTADGNPGDWPAALELMQYNSFFQTISPRVSMLVHAGRPLFVYQGIDSQMSQVEVMYRFSSSSDGMELSDWQEPGTLPLAKSSGAFLRMELLSGNPVVFCYAGQGQGLALCETGPVEGDSLQWQAGLVVDGSNYYKSLTLFEHAGQPAVFFVKSPTDELVFGRYQP